MLLLMTCFSGLRLLGQDYTWYYEQVIKAEELIGSESYKEALSRYESLPESYDFVFLSTYQTMAQLALILGERDKAINYIQKGIESGWEIKSIRQNTYLSNQLSKTEWRLIESTYEGLRSRYESGLNNGLREQVRTMFKKDQWKALGALFRFSAKMQDRYAERKFAPHSEMQMKAFVEILDKYGYPGEQLIGNDYWMSTILAHHNSISKDYAAKDKWYPQLKPRLRAAVLKGEMSPYDYGLIDEWYRLVKNEGVIYGLVDVPDKNSIAASNRLRKEIFLRSVNTRNGLIRIEEKTGMNFYTNETAWIEDEIPIE